jgi:hypothetical protein
MVKKNKGQTQAIQWTKKTQDKHRQHNGQKRQRTNTGNTMDRKDKGQTQAIQWTEKKNCIVCVCPLSCLSIVSPLFVFCLFCPLYRLCLSFVFFVHCMASVCLLSFLSIVSPVFVLCFFCPFYGLCLLFVFFCTLYRLCFSFVFFVKDKRQTQAIQWTKNTKDKHRQQNGQEGKKTSTGNTMYKKDKAQT